MENGLTFVIAGLVLITALAITACTDERSGQEGYVSVVPPAKSNRITITYELPENQEFLHIYSLLKEERQSLEKLQKLLSPIRIPWTLELLLAECDGEADAMYSDGTITICYEYIAKLWEAMPASTTANGIEPIDTVVGPFVDTILHEFAHALFDYLDIPVLGREEDAADQVSAYIYLHFSQNEARRLIMGTVYTYMQEVKNTDAPTMEDFAGEHGTSEQRRFNLLCMAYGYNPEQFKNIVVWGGLPQYRVDICEEEYELIALAFHTLIGPHVDKELAKKIFKKRWLPEQSSRMLIKQKLK